MTFKFWRDPVSVVTCHKDCHKDCQRLPQSDRLRYSMRRQLFRLDALIPSSGGHVGRPAETLIAVECRFTEWTKLVPNLKIKYL
ncbi:unnamed protein product [Danaus chrysippus]|uniref:(African queen) hypothetical protein n=1 Tax=Danaus chrysippus TaxID=151541 RepID=A0A8J2QNF6_9NEOP|nr:unnamed protein product [Danaus chrysippus]